MQQELIVDPQNQLFNREGMFFKEFPSEFKMIRYYTLLIVQKAPPEIKEINLLEQQISEIIKNAVKHGNQNDASKLVKVWYSFAEDEARLIVEDEGSGFQELEAWNEFNRKRLASFEAEDYTTLADYVSFRTDHSDENDGGNALFAALEYWNRGLIYNEKRNAVAVAKNYPKRFRALEGDS